ncbi:hypothetical protein ERO13_D13G134200v2 [Gossypium hirsutum]|uniref:Uncharacterized protein n=1 Tax=Gossypium tomentosum TaxID=34277 RepID=A0A5D2HZR2_GOSTO|nr:hypothetical protein ERO13_D13G134200v2 [Gossypium hirsutum]KAG4111967.1 hypothetical protein ERO13_D13G134200v2 [Gossypium hirsutum]TYH34996.1 hypothetical protein ES332_D13G163000v1 [Gossypium tomentosum]TYH34997.1 hypothetical protein ES332_D13G163000v1 [Gossypium tomentosum]
MGENTAEDVTISRKTKQVYKGRLSYKLTMGEVNSVAMDRHPTTTLYGTPGEAAAKSSGSNSNCLCSPTTHAGSFRCRYHRAGFPRAASVGSKLSMLGDTKSHHISDSLQAQ